MESGALEVKIARIAARRCDDQVLPTRPDTAFNVAEVLLEDLDRQTEIMAEIVELPLIRRQPFDNLLTPGPFHLAPQRLSAFSANHWWIGVSSM